MIKKGFTLLEMMIAISILSIMMIFLYRSNAALQFSNKTYQKEAQKIFTVDKIKEVIYLDFLLANSSVKFKHEKHKADTIFLQTSHSLHRRINPYIVYLVQNKKLFRVESLTQITQLPLAAEQDYSIDLIANVDSLDIYKSKKETQFLFYMVLQNKEKIVMKLTPLN